MYSIFLFLLVTLCVIEASVITITAYDDFNYHNDQIGSCNLLNCDQSCRRMGFPGGVCLNGQCKCYILLNSDDDTSVQRLEDTENSVTLRGCNNQECDQRCRRLKFPGGICVNGRCQCDNFRTTEGPKIEEQAQESVLASDSEHLEDAQQSNDIENCISFSSCNNKECDQRCRRLKFTGGICVNGRCKCDNFRQSEDFAALIEEILSLRSCNPQVCDQRCRRLKFPGSSCVNEHYKCDNFLNYCSQ